MTIAQEHSFGFSPPSNSSPDSDAHTSMLYDEDSKDGLFDDDKLGGRKMTGRKGPGPVAADKRATHNAIERARRESLNGRFMTLAEALPSMANVKRPSKSIIVNKALDFVFDAQVKEHALIKENNELRRQVDQLRQRLGMAPLPPPAPLLAAVAPEKPSLGRYHQSFSSAAGESFGDELGLGDCSPASSAEQATSPTTAPTSPVDMASPTLSYPSMPSIFGSPAVSGSPADSDASRGLSPSSAAPTSPFGAQLSAQQTAQAQAMLQAQYGFMGGALNPAMLSSQHGAALLAMHLQSQQAVMAQHHQQQQQHNNAFGSLQEMYGMAAGGGPMGGWGGYNPSAPGAMDGYSFLSQ